MKYWLFVSLVVIANFIIFIFLSKQLETYVVNTIVESSNQLKN